MPTIHIAGDSTAAKKEADKRPETGWGEKFAPYFTEKITINNQAKNGRSTKSFIEEGRLENLIKEFKAGDFLLIQFGHNDQKIQEEKGTLPFGNYIDYLQQYAQAAVDADVAPIFLTSVTRRDYLDTGCLNPEILGDYPKAMRTFAHQYQFPVLDVFSRSQSLFQDFSKEETKKFYLHLPPGAHRNYPEGLHDNTHFSPEGAEKVAGLIAQLIKESRLPLADYLKEGV